MDGTIYRIATGKVDGALGIEQTDDGRGRRGKIRGYASTSTLDVDKFRIPPESWILTHFNKILLWNHDRNHPIGVVEKLRITESGLYIDEADIDLEDDLGAREYMAMQRGYPRGFSVGFKALAKPKEEEDGVTVFERNALLEISIVTVPANITAQPVLAAADREAVMARMAQELKTPAMEIAIAEAIEERVGTVRSLADQIVDARLKAEREKWEIEQELAKIQRLVKPPVDTGGGGGGDIPAAKIPQGSVPEPDTAAAPKPGRGPSNAKPISGSLVPKETPEDAVDGHRHRVIQMYDDGSGFTGVARGTESLPHSHEISNWVVVPVNVAGVISDHPGTLYPGATLEANSDVVREIENDVITRPYPSEHACRLKEPGEFVRFRRDNSKNPNVIIGFRKDGSSDVQAFRYPKGKWSADKARAHCREHKGRFEAAKDESKSVQPDLHLDASC